MKKESNSERTSFQKAAKDLVAQMTLEEMIGQMRHDAPAIPRLDVPAYNWWNECLHGVARNGTATVFPQSIALAATFDVERMKQVASAIAAEARSKFNENRSCGSTVIYQGLTMCAPNINIFRDPRWGRGQETYGEDPFLTGEMATAYVNGLQGDGPYWKAGATLKHFAVHSGPETERHGFDADVNDEDLYGTYLRAFRHCIEKASPMAVMTAYSAVRGEPCVASPRLLRDILLDEFGFKGFVESDAGGVNDLHQGHHLTPDVIESAALAVNSGCHLNIGDSFTHLSAAVERGLVDPQTIVIAVEKLFEARFRLGLFSTDCEYDLIPTEIVECPEHIRLNRKMAHESIVLLKNDGILPLDPSRTLAVIGPTADDRSVLLANYCGTPTRQTTLLEGILDAAVARVRYARGCDISRQTVKYDEEHPMREAVSAARDADIVILCMGLNPSLEGEGNDRVGIELPYPQQQLFDEMRAIGKPIVFVNVSGSCVALGEQDSVCAAVVQCFYPGAEGGHALADILFGLESPSGRLPVTFYASTDDLPPFRDYTMKNRTYRYFQGRPVYPFGYGLSYVRFEYGAPLRTPGHLTVTVQNTGDRTADEIVQLYATDGGPQLIAFRRIRLEPDEVKNVDFEIDEQAGILYVGGGPPLFRSKA